MKIKLKKKFLDGRTLSIILLDGRTTPIDTSSSIQPYTPLAPISYYLPTIHPISTILPKTRILYLSIYHVDRNTNTWNFFLYTPPKHLLIHMEFIYIVLTNHNKSQQIV